MSHFHGNWELDFWLNLANANDLIRFFFFFFFFIISVYDHYSLWDWDWTWPDTFKMLCLISFICKSKTWFDHLSLLQLALLNKYEEILLKATAAAEDRKLTGSSKYKVSWQSFFSGSYSIKNEWCLIRKSEYLSV